MLSRWGLYLNQKNNIFCELIACSEHRVLWIRPGPSLGEPGRRVERATLASACLSKMGSHSTETHPQWVLTVTRAGTGLQISPKAIFRVATLTLPRSTHCGRVEAYRPESKSAI